MTQTRMLILALAAGLWTVAAAASLPAQQASPQARQEITNAQGLMGRGQYREALEALKRANQLEHAACATCYFLLGQSYEHLQDYARAAENAAAAVKLAGDDKSFAAAAHNLQGLALLGEAKRGDAGDSKLREAEAEFRAALSLTAALPVAHYNLGLALLRQERDREGVAEFQAYLKDPVPPDYVARARRMVADPRRARETFAPDYSFTTLDGARISSDALRGKVVLLDFWGTWCEACVAAEPAIAEIYRRFSAQPDGSVSTRTGAALKGGAAQEFPKRAFELIAVSSDSDDAAWRSFIAKNKMVWPEYRDASEQILHAFSVYYFPTYIVIDSDGIIRYRTSGYRQGTYAEIVAAMNRALEFRATEEEAFPAWWP